MLTFKITITPIIKTRDWVVNSVKHGRKEKICEICKKTIKIGEPALTFLQRGFVGVKQSFKTRYACKSKCQDELAKKIHNEEHKELSPTILLNE